MTMNHWKQSVLALFGLSVLALAGCAQSQKAADGGPAPNAADRAAMAAEQQKVGQNAAAQAAAAKAQADASAAAKAKGSAGTTGQ